MTRYVHTNLIAEDPQKLIAFYKTVFGCKSIGETRDLRGVWLDQMTGITNAHLVGEHLLLPGYGADHPTLEIFSYDQVFSQEPRPVNTKGITHLAFEVEDVSATLERILAEGGSTVGELVHAEYEDGRKATFVYARDPEGNILELQSWA